LYSASVLDLDTIACFLAALQEIRFDVMHLKCHDPDGCLWKCGMMPIPSTVASFSPDLYKPAQYFK
jgi:hypothetical protein